MISIGLVGRSIGLLVARDVAMAGKPRRQNWWTLLPTGKVLAAIEPRLSWPFTQSGGPTTRPDGGAVCRA